MTPIEIITGIIGLIQWLSSGYKLNKEAEVAEAIKAVERKVGLTEDIKWAWAWFDRRYPELDLGDSWKGYCHYAGHTIGPWPFDDPAHWQNTCEHCLEQISYYLDEAMRKYEEEHPGDVGYQFQPWYLKYLPYGLMAGLGTALIIVLATRRRK